MNSYHIDHAHDSIYNWIKQKYRSFIGYDTTLFAIADTIFTYEAKKQSNLLI